MDPCCRSTRHRGGQTETFRGQLNNTEAGDSVKSTNLDVDQPYNCIQNWIRFLFSLSPYFHQLLQNILRRLLFLWTQLQPGAGQGGGGGVRHPGSILCGLALKFVGAKGYFNFL